jgi:PIN domain nuclease of toxin-antitoxin system
MKVLIDTQILIWYQLNDPKLHANVYDLLTRLENTVYVSQISLVEIAIKQKIGKLPELDVSISTLANLIEQDGFIMLPLQTQHIEAYSEIPLFPEHRDPFDRLLLATAFSENIPIVSSDGNFELYKQYVQIFDNA